jgi:hypothetical protein
MGVRWFLTRQTRSVHVNARKFVAIITHLNILMLSSHVRLGLSSGLSPWGFPVKFRTHLSSLPCPAHLDVLDLITQIILGSLCNFILYDKSQTGKNEDLWLWISLSLPFESRSTISSTGYGCSLQCPPIHSPVIQSCHFSFRIIQPLQMTKCRTINKEINYSKLYYYYYYVFGRVLKDKIATSQNVSMAGLWVCLPRVTCRRTRRRLTV